MSSSTVPVRSSLMRDMTSLENTSAVSVGDVEETRISRALCEKVAWSNLKFSSDDATNSLLRTITDCFVLDATLVAIAWHLDSKLAVQMNKSISEGRID